MIEKLSPEIIIGAESAIGLLALAFSRALKQEVRESQGFRCDRCGKKTKFLQVHHKVPQCLGGSDRKVNSVALCPSCHVEVDNEAMLEGTIYPGVFIDQVPTSQFKNKNIRQKMIYKYRARRRR
jgi:hypothetical protein